MRRSLEPRHLPKDWRLYAHTRRVARHIRLALRAKNQSDVVLLVWFEGRIAHDLPYILQILKEAGCDPAALLFTAEPKHLRLISSSDGDYFGPSCAIPMHWEATTRPLKRASFLIEDILETPSTLAVYLSSKLAIQWPKQPNSWPPFSLQRKPNNDSELASTRGLAMAKMISDAFAGGVNFPMREKLDTRSRWLFRRKMYKGRW